MKIFRTLILVIQSHLLVSVLSSDAAPNLYQIPGIDVPMEFSDDAHRNQVERDISQFDNLGAYQPKKYGELDHDSPNLHLEITQQIIERVKDNKHKDFFEITDNVKNSEPFRKGYAINYDEYYNNKTGKYERAFKSQEVTKALQNLHVSDFNTQTDNAKKQANFIQTEAKEYAKRPSYLPNDAKSQFLEVSEESKIAALRYDWQYLYSYNCWASSRWEFAFLFICWNWVWSTIYIMWIFPFSYLRPYANICIWIWFLSYPCSSSIGGRGITWFWMSEKMTEEGKMHPITFRQEFDVIRRVKFHNLLFMVVPDEVKIEISQDHKTWEDATDFVKTPDRSRWWWWWWSYQYHYPPSTFAKSCKIIMKGLRKNWYGNRHGLWWVDFYTQTQTVQVMDKTPPADPRCVARAEVGYYQTNKPFILMNCLDAILQNDSREAFFLNYLYIQQWADNMCLSGGDKHTKDSPQNIVSKKCRDSDEYKWVIDRLGRMMSKAAPTSCIAAKDDNSITQVQTYGFVKVTASLSDSRVNAYDTIDPNASGFWAAPLELKTATWEIIFDRQYMVEEITIQFKFPPKKVSVNVLTPENKWFTIITEQPEDEMIVQMTPSQIIGVNIHMLELDLDKVTEFQRPAFGIKKVICKRPGTPLSIQTCSYQGKDSKLMNRFKIENIEYIDTSYLVPYRGAKAYMHVVYEATKVIVEQFVVKIQVYMVVVKVAEDIGKNIQKINKLVDAIYGQLGPYKKYVLMDEGKGGEAKGKCYACSPETAALACVYVKKKNPFRLNGFFWIKTKCMPAAARVFCDFEEADANFYQYVGNYADKATPVKYKTIQDLQEMCDKVGLQPVEIQSKKQALNIIEYLNLVDANSRDEIGIPFAYQWEYKFLGDKYQSLNSAKSKETTQFLKALMEPQTMMDKLTTIGSDLLILKRSRNKLYKGYLSSFQLRGLVCSENKGTKEYKNGQSGSTCETTLAMMGSPKVNTILKVGCPADCAKAKGFKVIGTGPFSEFSSICRAAVYSGAINDVEGGLVEVKVIAGKETYKEGDTNDVKAVEGTGSPAQKAFNVVKKPEAVACPNLKPKKKSFISFNDIINKVKVKKQQSFIESKEQLQVQDQMQVEAKSDDDGASGEPGMDMKKAIGYVNKQLSKKLIIIEKYKQFIKDTQLLFKSYELILASIFGSTLNPTTQATLLSTTNLRITATKQMIEDLVLKGQAKLAGLMELYLKRLDDLFFLQRYEPHNEQYGLDWQSTYIVMDNSKTKEGPSQWKFTKEDVYPHTSGIAQSKAISCGKSFEQPDGECTASIQQVKYKKFYDFKLTMDFKVRKMGHFGIVFRMVDQYNYYSVEFKDDNVQFRRMKEGKQHIISKNKIDKILSDTWYNVQLLVVETVFKVMIGKEKKEDISNPKKYDALKTALKGEDDYFKNGFQGLYTDGTLGYFMDQYQIVAIDCWKDPFKLEKAIKHTQPESSRFLEVYKADINQVWIQFEQEEIRWEYVQNGQGRKKALKKDMNNKQSQKKPMLLINKQMIKGWIGFDLYLKAKTSEFSLITYYVNDKNYHEFVIQKDKVTFKEVINGKKQIVKVEENKNVKPRVWYTVYFQLSSDIIETWFEEALPEKSDRVRQVLFSKELDRPDTKGVGVGISASNGAVFIDEFRHYPGKVPPPVEKDKKEDDNNDNNDDNNDEKKDKPDVPKPVSCEETGDCPKPVFDYKICLNTTKTMQNNWCTKQSDLPGPLSDCKENFCIKCCDKQVGAKKNIAEKCVEECSFQEAEKDKTYYQCFNSKDPKHSIQAICSMQFPKKPEKPQEKQCKTDFCDLCCIVHPLILQKGMLKPDMDDCYKKCHEKFDK